MIRLIRRAKIGAGKFGDVAPLAKEMTGLIESVTGTPVQFYVQHGGEYGRVSW